MPVLEAETTNTLGAAGNFIDVTIPAGVVAGERLLIIVSSDSQGNGDQFTIVDTDWTKLSEAGASTTDTHVAVFHRESDGTETGTVEVGSVLASDMVGRCQRWSDVDTTTPFDVTGAEQNFPAIATTRTIVGETTTVDGCTALAVWGFDGGDGGVFSTPTAGWTLSSVLASGGTGFAGHQGGYAQFDQVAAGAVTDLVLENDNVGDSVSAFVFAMRPAAALFGAVAELGVAIADGLDAATSIDAGVVGAVAELGIAIADGFDATTTAGPANTTAGQLGIVIADGLDATTTLDAANVTAGQLGTAIADGLDATTAVGPANQVDGQLGTVIADGLDATTALGAVVGAAAELGTVIANGLDATTTLDAANQVDGQLGVAIADGLDATTALGVVVGAVTELGTVIADGLDATTTLGTEHTVGGQLGIVIADGLDATTAITTDIIVVGQLGIVIADGLDATTLLFTGNRGQLGIVIADGLDATTFQTLIGNTTDTSNGPEPTVYTTPPQTPTTGAIPSNVYRTPEF